MVTPSHEGWPPGTEAIDRKPDLKDLVFFRTMSGLKHEPMVSSSEAPLSAMPSPRLPCDTSSLGPPRPQFTSSHLSANFPLRLPTPHPQPPCSPNEHQLMPPPRGPPYPAPQPRSEGPGGQVSSTTNQREGKESIGRSAHPYTGTRQASSEELRSCSRCYR